MGAWQTPQVFENSSSLYNFWKAQGLEIHINAFHLYQMNINYSVFMKAFAIWKSDTAMKNNDFFIYRLYTTHSSAKNHWLRKLTHDTL